MCERVEGPSGALGVSARGIDVLGALDPATLSDAELHETVTTLQAEASRLAALRSRHLAAWDARRLWADDGSKSAAARLARECELSSESAGRELKRARKLRAMPATAEALAQGKISVDRADLLAHANQPAFGGLFARDETMLLDTVAGLRHGDALRAVQYWIELAEDQVEDKKRPTSARQRDEHLTAVRTIWGGVYLQGGLGAISGTQVLSELDRLERELFEAEWGEAKAIHGDETRVEHLKRTASQRRAAALVQMARRSRAMPPGSRLPRPLITVLNGYGAFSKICELADGTVISPGDVVPLLTEADIERIVFDGPSRVIDVGVKQRFFTGGTRRAIEVRDRHCVHPSGCDVPAERCDIDHIVPPNDGGLTVQENGRCLCAFHNRQRHNRARVGEEKQRPPPDDG